MPTALIIAGPNGAGKTTFANAWLGEQAEAWEFLNADEIGREPELTKLPQVQRDVRAGRLLLSRLEVSVAARRNLVLETTLSSRLHARRMLAWREAGYRIELIYLKLANVEESINRVASRVSRGGHGIPEGDLRRRFERSLYNLEETYKPLADVWEVWESRIGKRILIARSQR